MIEKLKALFHKHRGTVLYLFFGALTTVVNYAVYFPLYNFAKLTATESNVIAWAVAVIFAYITSKLFVFENKGWGRTVILPEFARFVGSRVISGAVETITIFLTVDVLFWNGNLMKVLLAFFVIVFNYVASRWFVFKK